MARVNLKYLIISTRVLSSLCLAFFKLLGTRFQYIEYNDTSV